MGDAYPKAARLRRDSDFALVRTRGRRVRGRQAVVRVARTSTGVARLGIGVPRAYGDAVRRNRFRRLVREAFRSLRGTLPPCDLLVQPEKGLREPTLEGLVEDLREAAR